MRLKILTLLMLIVLSISLIVTMQHFGFDTLEDNFIAQLYTSYKSSAQFMCFYGLLNFYLYAMAYVYSPSGPAVHGKLVGSLLTRKIARLSLFSTWCPCRTDHSEG